MTICLGLLQSITGDADTMACSKHLVFAYGSLKYGFGNHYLLSGSKLLGSLETQPVFTMYDLGAYPAVTESGSCTIHGEVYEVAPDTFSEIDRLEGYPDFYNRIQITTPYGLAWIYIVSEDYVLGKRVVESGVWLDG